MKSLNPSFIIRKICFIFIYVKIIFKTMIIPSLFKLFFALRILTDNTLFNKIIIIGILLVFITFKTFFYLFSLEIWVYKLNFILTIFSARLTV